ncbi:hypothetical protein P885DRAFT_32649 [Corynascus similis CBS 632.67]
MAPGDEYQPIPLEDEKHSETSSWRSRRSLEDFYQAQSVQRTLCQHWVWLGHIALLSVSTTLFALAFCLHYGRLSNLAATPQSSIYCECPC